MPEPINKQVENFLAPLRNAIKAVSENRLSMLEKDLTKSEKKTKVREEPTKVTAVAVDRKVEFDEPVF